MNIMGWEQYRREVVLPAGFRCVSPGVWALKDEDGREVATFMPFEYRREWGCQRWQHFAEAGLGPDGEKVVQEER